MEPVPSVARNSQPPGSPRSQQAQTLLWPQYYTKVPLLDPFLQVLEQKINGKAVRMPGVCILLRDRAKKFSATPLCMPQRSGQTAEAASISSLTPLHLQKIPV